jgi:hypothetical protein
MSHCRSPGLSWCGILELFVVCLNYYAVLYSTVQYTSVSSIVATKSKTS